MIKEFFRKYLSIIFILATFMGVFHTSNHHHHHHNDLDSHHDCEVCTVASNLANVDTPTEVIYISSLKLYCEPILTPLCTLIDAKTNSTLKARAPPKLS